MLRRRALSTISVAILVIAAPLAVGNWAAAQPGKGRQRHCTSKVSKSSAKSAKRRPKCRKPKHSVPRTRSTAPTTPAPSLSATLIVHVPGGCGPRRCETPTGTRELTSQPLRITRLGAGGEALSSLETHEHTVHVAPGLYEIAVLGDNGGAFTATKVTVSADQELEVTLEVDTE